MQEKLEEVKAICIKTFLAPFEGTGPVNDGKYLAYVDPVGIVTIYMGLTYHADGTPVQLGEQWDEDYAILQKSKVLNKFLRGLLDLSPSLVNESPLRIASVLSFCYNLGLGSYRVSTFKKRVDAKDWVGAMQECRKWNKAKGKVLKGLTRRREAEGIALVLG